MKATNPEGLRNVLIGVDPQIDFITGSLAVSEGEQVIEPLNEVAAATRRTGGDVAWTRDWHPPQTPHFEQWPVHCVANTKGAAYPTDLIVESTDIIISKGTGQTDGYSGMEGISDDGTTLETIIRPRTPQERVRVFIGGLATDFCVQATALDLARTFEEQNNVSLYLIRDAIRAVNLQPTDGAEAVAAMQAAGIEALTSDEIRQRFFEQEGVQL